MSLYGLKGFNESSGTNVLLAGYGNDIVNVDTGLGYNQNISSTNNQEMEVFLDCVFWQNFSDRPRTFDGSTWSQVRHVDAKTPLAKYIMAYQNQLYLAYVNYASTDWPSRVWYSDIPKNNTITWGLDYGSDLVQTYESAVVTSVTAKFITRNVKIGDPFYITTGGNAGEYIVNSVDSNTQITLTKKLYVTATGSSYWTGRNFFDVDTDNNDYITGLSKNNGKLLIFKNDSLHRYDKSTLKQVKDVPGTTSPRSISTIRGYTIYFHGSIEDKTGFYLYDGVNSQNISRGIQPFIDSIPSANYDDVVSWREGDEYRAYTGDLSLDNSHNTAYKIYRPKSVMSYYVPTNSWDIGTVNDVITVATNWRQSNLQKTFIGGGSEVFRTDYGKTHDFNPIPFVIETKPIYPRGAGIVGVFTRIKIVARDSYGIHIEYKLWGDPYEVDDKYYGLGDIRHDTTELTVPQNHSRAAGIQLRFSDSGVREQTPAIEKIIVYSYSDSSENPEQESSR